MASLNFGFLGSYDPELVQLGSLAERYFRDDPPAALGKLRILAEHLAKLIAARHALYLSEREAFEDILRRLSYERILPRKAADLFHYLRKSGNAAVHENKGDHAQALEGLKFARQIGIWFHRTYGKVTNFDPGPFTPPAEPRDATAELKAQIEELNRRLAKARGEAAIAKQEAEAHAKARETAEEQLKREATERLTWEQLAEESQAERILITAKLAELRQSADMEDPLIERLCYMVSPAAVVRTKNERQTAKAQRKLATIQFHAEQEPSSARFEFIQRGEKAAEQIDLDEADTRALIDGQLTDRGWEAETKHLSR